MRAFILIISFLYMGVGTPAVAESLIIDARSSSYPIGVVLPYMLPNQDQCIMSPPSVWDAPVIFFGAGTYGSGHFDMPPIEELVQREACDDADHKKTVVKLSIDIRTIIQNQQYYLGNVGLFYEIDFIPQAKFNNPSSCSNVTFSPEEVTGGKARAVCSVTLRCEVTRSPLQDGVAILVGTNDPDYPLQQTSGNICNTLWQSSDIPREFNANPDSSFDRFMFFPYSMILSVPSLGG